MGVNTTVVPVLSSVIPVFFMSFPRKRESRERQGGGEYNLTNSYLHLNLGNTKLIKENKKRNPEVIDSKIIKKVEKGKLSERVGRKV